jgi:hypothetical protein
VSDEREWRIHSDFDVSGPDLFDEERSEDGLIVVPKARLTAVEAERDEAKAELNKREAGTPGSLAVASREGQARRASITAGLRRERELRRLLAKRETALRADADIATAERLREIATAALAGEYPD